eukprot:635123-Pyramimonas_sp.AAC.1
MHPAQARASVSAPVVGDWFRRRRPSTTAAATTTAMMTQFKVLPGAARCRMLWGNDDRRCALGGGN